MTEGSDPMEDAAIISLFHERSEQAIAELDRACGPLCRQIARNILGSEADAEECVQDAYLAIWKAIPPESPAPLRPWVCKVTRNLALKRYHENTAQKRCSRYDAALEELEAVLPAAVTAEDALLEKELAGHINGFLSGLDRESRALFLRRYWYGDGVEELAKDLGLRPNTISVRLSRIRGKLKHYLKEEGYDL